MEEGKRDGHVRTLVHLILIKAMLSLTPLKKVNTGCLSKMILSLLEKILYIRIYLDTTN